MTLGGIKSVPVLPLIRRLVLILPALGLTGCNAEYRLFHPEGPVATAEWHFTLISTSIMMLIIVPVTVLVCVFAWRYRKSSNARYDPAWSHSMSLEMLMWGVPLLIVVVLGFFTYQGVFETNPAGPTALNQNTSGPPPLRVDVITTDWQWLFIYPDLHIAAVDDLVVPAGQTVSLRLTSATVTNDFYIPQVAPMIDVMPGMRTLDAFRVDQPGSYEGFSADFSGAGFSWMQFSTRILPPADFTTWVKQTQGAANQLTFAQFQKFAQPTVNMNAKPAYFSGVDPDLFNEVDSAVQQGEVFPTPEEVDTKDRYPQPNGKPAVPKASS